jgi:hypothetical protein
MLLKRPEAHASGLFVGQGVTGRRKSFLGAAFLFGPHQAMPNGNVTTIKLLGTKPSRNVTDNDGSKEALSAIHTQFIRRMKRQNF